MFIPSLRSGSLALAGSLGLARDGPGPLTPQRSFWHRVGPCLGGAYQRSLVMGDPCDPHLADHRNISPGADPDVELFRLHIESLQRHSHLA